MERFLGALSITLLLSGLSVVAQVQSVADPMPSRLHQAEVEQDSTLSRAEFASILVKTFQLNRRSPAPRVPTLQLQDVAASHWAYDDIQAVLHSHMMNSDPQGLFYPEQRLTRAEAFSILAQAYAPFQLSSPTEVLNRDVHAEKIPCRARPLASALRQGFANARTGDRINPLSPITRNDLIYALNVYAHQQGFSTRSLF